MMRSGVPRPTVAQQRQQDEQRAGGCIACRMNLSRGLLATGMAIEIHHQVKCGRRLGQDFTVALCHWHHQADAWPVGYDLSRYTDLVVLFGPSLKRSPGQFQLAYGNNAEQLEYQHRVVAAIRDGCDPWPECCPLE